MINLVFLYHSLARRSSTEYLGLDIVSTCCATFLFKRFEDLSTKKQKWLALLTSDPQSLKMGSNAIQQEAKKKKSNVACK
mmetsp:Transcript_22023/g.47886  ORF Transcript_22023/g.47886 Transcript_22023/m.47886 type:complete len:80 (-) Transcript_22023:995-1234(-)